MTNHKSPGKTWELSPKVHSIPLIMALTVSRNNQQIMWTQVAYNYDGNEIRSRAVRIEEAWRNVAACTKFLLCEIEESGTLKFQRAHTEDDKMPN